MGAFLGPCCCRPRITAISNAAAEPDAATRRALVCFTFPHQELKIIRNFNGSLVLSRVQI